MAVYIPNLNSSYFRNTKIQHFLVRMKITFKFTSDWCFKRTAEFKFIILISRNIITSLFFVLDIYLGCFLLRNMKKLLEIVKEKLSSLKINIVH